MAELEQEVIVCDGCSFSFEVEPLGLPYCIRCQRIATHLGVDLEAPQKENSVVLKAFFIICLIVIGGLVGEIIWGIFQI